VSGCVFCRIVAGELPANVVLREARVSAFLDTSPLALGHVLVVPRAHVATLDDLAPEAVGTLFEAARRVSIAVQRGLGADGSFVAVNTRVSQSVPHVHVHVVPRREGDGLFSPRPIWRRRSYASPQEAADHAERVRAALPEA
jgi:histidine triad (HIT) family protein